MTRGRRPTISFRMQKSTESRIRAKEDRLLRRYRSYRGGYVGASFLSVLSVAGLFTSFLTKENMPALPDGTTFMFWSIWFWAALATHAGSRLDHITTIRMYRNQLTEDDVV